MISFCRAPLGKLRRIYPSELADVSVCVFNCCVSSITCILQFGACAAGWAEARKTLARKWDWGFAWLPTQPAAPHSLSVRTPTLALECVDPITGSIWYIVFSCNMIIKSVLTILAFDEVWIEV